MSRSGRALLALLLLAGGTARAASPAATWPPRLSERYPDLELVDGDGRRVRLSDYAGKVLLIEPVGMSCPACQAFAGARAGTGLGGVTPQRDLPSIETLVERHAGGVSLGDERIVLVQLLLYDLEMGAPDAADVRAWTQAFPTKLPNRHVLAPATDIRSPVTHALVPGFQLVDASFVLRSDAAGHHPRNDLYQELLPLVASLVADVPRAGAAARLPAEQDIDAAYRAIPHRRTTYRAAGSPLGTTTAIALERMLALVDAAVTLRVETLRALGTGEASSIDAYDRRLDLLERELEGIPPAATFRPALDLVREALRAQRAYFRSWRDRLRAGERFAFQKDDPQVQASSRCLHRAYGELMRLYPNEGADNRQAFFDHLCALDFI